MFDSNYVLRCGAGERTSTGEFVQCYQGVSVRVHVIIHVAGVATADKLTTPFKAVLQFAQYQFARIVSVQLLEDLSSPELRPAYISSVVSVQQIKMMIKVATSCALGLVDTRRKQASAF